MNRERLVQIVSKWVSVDPLGQPPFEIPAETKFIPLPSEWTPRDNCYACGSSRAERAEYRHAFTTGESSPPRLCEWVNWTCPKCGYERTTLPVGQRTEP